jgi:hypothetical protein
MARWETSTRWYEAHVLSDLFGGWVVVRTWGGKGSRRRGGLIEPVANQEAGVRRVSEICARRRQHGYL